MVESEMSRIPDAITMDGVSKPKWNYTTGLELLAIMDAGERYNNEAYGNYALSWLERMVAEDGESIQTYKLSNYNLDHICPGRLLFCAYDLTGEERYLKAIDLLWRQLCEQPRTPEGGYWHKKAYPNQMWLDGLYMAEPFKAEYLVRYACRIENGEHLCGNAEFYKIGVGGNESLCKAARLDLLGDSAYRALAVIGCFIEYKSVHNFYLTLFIML
jgi:unsaturated rhamnogalacturonyl hydrolase